MAPPKLLKASDGSLLVERFSPIRRVEHVFTILVFVLLVLTGFPQKFYDALWAKWIINVLGGLGQTRSLHRIVGLVFVGHAAVHMTGMIMGAMAKKLRFTLLPTPQDLRDAWNNLRYYLGYRNEQPKFPKFDYRQKFEYIGLMLGGLVMVFTGLILLYPTTAASILPGEIIPAARVAHSNEALLALLVLVVWHVYGSHLSPEIFPMDKTIFTGYISVEELEERHTLEYERLFPNGVPEDLVDGDTHPADSKSSDKAEVAEEPSESDSQAEDESETTPSEDKHDDSKPE